ncbi:MAG: nucleoside phosphorylase [Pseudomonadota bacterium]
MSGFIGVVVGLKSEADAVRSAMAELAEPDRNRIRIAISGADTARAEACARTFAEDGASALLSVGVSGGLEAGVGPGVILIGLSVVSAGETYEVSEVLLETIRAAAPALRHASLAGVDAVVTTADEKSALAARTGAAAVDMESHAVARVAAATGTPFAAIRAVADPADRALPPSTADAIASDGSVRVLSVLTKIAGRPQDLPALLKLGKDQEAALASLRSGLGDLLPRLLLVV